MAENNPVPRSAHTRFEKARIIGARALQVAMGAPIVLANVDSLVDPVRVAEMEYYEGLIPITVARASAGARPVPELVYSAPENE